MTKEEAKAIYVAAGGDYDQDDRIEGIRVDMECVVAATTDRKAADQIRWWDCWNRRYPAIAFARRARAFWKLIEMKLANGWPRNGSQLVIGIYVKGDRTLCWVRKDPDPEIGVEVQFPEYHQRWHALEWARANGWTLRPVFERKNDTEKASTVGAGLNGQQGAK